MSGAPREPAPASTEAERRRLRRAEIFGEALPETTADETGDGWSERDTPDPGSEEWLRRQVPPHHG